MPANLVRCRMCRAMLNPDLHRSDVEIPAFFELQEIESVKEVELAGFHIQCPHCEQELRINRKYIGQAVACRFCSGQFKLELRDRRVKLRACFAGCPHCEKELRLAAKYISQKVACKFCDGHVRITDPARLLPE